MPEVDTVIRYNSFAGISLMYQWQQCVFII